MLVPDVAHQFLHHVLHGEQALGAAVLVHHNGHVGLGALELAHQVVNFGAGGHMEHRVNEGGQLGAPVVAGGKQVLLVDDAHHVVQGLMVHRHPGVPLLGKQGGGLLHGGGVLQGHDIHPGGENVRGLQIVKANGGTDELALLGVQTALVLRLGDHGHQFLVGNAHVLLGVEDFGQQLLPQGKEEGGRGENHHEKPQDGGGEQGETLRGLFGQTLGGDLAENQNHNGEHHRGYGGAAGLAQQVDKEHGGQGRGHIVDNVIANQDGGQELIVFVGQSQHTGGPGISVVRPTFQPDAVEGGKSRFGGGEIRTHHHHTNQYD